MAIFSSLATFGGKMLKVIIVFCTGEMASNRTKAPAPCPTRKRL